MREGNFSISFDGCTFGCARPLVAIVGGGRRRRVQRRARSARAPSTEYEEDLDARASTVRRRSSSTRRFRRSSRCAACRSITELSRARRSAEEADPAICTRRRTRASAASATGRGTAGATSASTSRCPTSARCRRRRRSHGRSYELREEGEQVVFRQTLSKPAVAGRRARQGRPDRQRDRRVPPAPAGADQVPELALSGPARVAPDVARQHPDLGTAAGTAAGRQADRLRGGQDLRRHGSADGSRSRSSTARCGCSGSRSSPRCS